MIVVTGPTGSGKSTTMYAMLSKLNSVSRNIVTVEDPVEYRLPGINQVASDNEHGLGFANALKYIMRQDPDVIMVGEIRDHETATTAVQAALTGHLLISTLHTNDAVGAVARLNDLGDRQLQDRRRAAGFDCPAAAAVDLHRVQRTVRCESQRACSPTALQRQARSLPTTDLLSRPRLQEVPRHRLLRADSDLRNHGRHAGDGRRDRKRTCRRPSFAKSPSSEGMVELAAAGIEQVLAGRTTLEEVFYKISS